MDLDNLIQEIEKKVLSQSEIDSTIFFSLNAKIALINGKATLVGTKISRPRRSPKERTIQIQQSRAKRAGKSVTKKPKFYPMYVDYQSNDNKMDFNMSIDMSIEKPEVVVDHKIHKVKKVKQVKQVKQVKKIDSDDILKIKQDNQYYFKFLKRLSKDRKTAIQYYEYWNLLTHTLKYDKDFNANTLSIDSVFGDKEQFLSRVRKAKARIHPDRFPVDYQAQLLAESIFKMIGSFEQVYLHIEIYLKWKVQNRNGVPYAGARWAKPKRAYPENFP